MNREYARRVNAALEFIDRNLGEDISLAKLASVACFSPFHFHRIFSAFVGELPAEYVRRLRLEKAARYLATDQDSTVTDIALACGFSTSALFCRLFRARFGMTPTVWRTEASIYRKNRQHDRKIGKDASFGIGVSLSAKPKYTMRRTPMKKHPVVKVKDIPPLRVAYVKHMKGYEDAEGIGEAFRTVFCWAGPRGMIHPDMKVLGVCLDDPEITPKDKCRYCACVTVTESAKAEGQVGIMTLRPGKYAVGRFEGGEEIFKEAYAYMYGDWLPQSGWQPDDAPSFESYIGEHGGTQKKKKFVFDLHIPVKAL